MVSLLRKILIFVFGIQEMRVKIKRCINSLFKNTVIPARSVYCGLLPYWKCINMLRTICDDNLVMTAPLLHGNESVYLFPFLAEERNEINFPSSTRTILSTRQLFAGVH